MYRPIGLVAALLALVAAGSAAAQGKLEAHYAVSFNGLVVGQGAWVIDVTEAGYSAAGSAAVVGVLKLLHPGKGSAAAQGRFVGGKVEPVRYTGTSETKKRSESIQMALADGVVRDVKMDPTPSNSPNNIPLTEEHRKSVVDPMSAALMPVSGNGDLSGAAACSRTLEIFDGRYRYDLELSYERSEPALDLDGYSGTLAVCRVAYKPIAGHNPNRRETKQAMENRNIFVWLAPISGTRVFVPARVSVATMFGTLVVHATRFSSSPGTRADAGPAAR